MKVIVAMSGGVDSSVAAALLQREGHDVEGIFMKNWSPETIQSLTDCPWEQDQADAAAVCAHLGIPFRSVNFEREYKAMVVDYMLEEYAVGRTPNPDIMCNSEIKFKAFMAEARRSGAEMIATGHYARKVEVRGRSYVARGVDARKDQSYFLWKLTEDQVGASLFPVGDLPKSEVRELALEFGLPTATKKDSQGICFIGHIDLKRFLHEHITAKAGEVFLLPKYEQGVGLDERMARAEVVGRHEGSIFYTLGERAGAIVNNGTYRRLRNGADVPYLYVMYKNVRHNSLYVTEDRNDPHMLAHVLELEDWRLDSHSPSPLGCQARYQQIPVPVASTSLTDDGTLRVEMGEAVWAAAPGQFVALYDGDRVVGGGTIKKVGVGQEVPRA